MRLAIPFIVAVVLMGLVVQLIWWILGTAAAYGLYRVARRTLREHRAQAVIAARNHAELAVRAEIQHRWYLAGDPRGIYGRYAPAVMPI